MHTRQHLPRFAPWPLCDVARVVSQLGLRGAVSFILGVRVTVRVSSAYGGRGGWVRGKGFRVQGWLRGQGWARPVGGGEFSYRVYGLTRA